MVEAPLAMSAHFTDKRKAEKFRKALIKSLGKIMKNTKITSFFLDSIQVQEESGEALTYSGWEKMKGVRGK